ncbi:pyridoxal-phosphate dependent enzyme [Alsobacter sp. SYSU M60028]|uniref:Pyridoxal-phosphate dependent enzyme n=1 Tax=Alsobacter ponti TaxID=2962936 RepID=A0ABT1L951_9HYPH|nr:pyridoxal-phosphate dependent enzyme [Alsobacter ponti]MCP8937476.1 pyridoxal-phosphate dependent enzyme [Alsobacter ponti]
MICQDQPRERFVHLPTPLEPAPRLSEALGIDLLIKREDLAGLCVGGNKARLLEFAIGSLRGKGVDTLVAYASDQSNKLRDIAAVAARCGMRAVLLVPGDGHGGEPPQGNRLLFDILGAEVRVVAPGLDRAGVMAAQEQVRDECARAGRRAAVLDRMLDYGVDATIGYVDAAEELHAQLSGGPAPHSVFIAVGAGMTAAGLALGLKHLGSPARVVGVCISSPAEEVAPEIERHAARAAERLGIPTRLGAGDLTLIDDQAAIGYGTLTPPLVEVIRLFARLHGLVLDPVYNAKVARALVDEVATGGVPKGARVVFVNTGGSPATYNYAPLLAGGVAPGRPARASMAAG